jgi:hypothetical protein
MKAGESKTPHYLKQGLLSMAKRVKPFALTTLDGASIAQSS